MKGAWRKFPLVHSQHVGDKYIVTLGGDDLDHYPNDFVCRVNIRDRVTGDIHERCGHGKYIGNFSPIWVTFKGKSVTLDEVLREMVHP